jgi:hypothetical protein
MDLRLRLQCSLTKQSDMSSNGNITDELERIWKEKFVA